MPRHQMRFQRMGYQHVKGNFDSFYNEIALWDRLASGRSLDPPMSLGWRIRIRALLMLVTVTRRFAAYLNNAMGREQEAWRRRQG